MKYLVELDHPKSGVPLSDEAARANIFGRQLNFWHVFYHSWRL